MALVRSQPHDLFDLRREMSRRFGSMLGNGEMPDCYSPNAWRPAIDVAESEDDFVLTTDLPGIDRQDIDVSVVDNQLIIKGERKQEIQSKDRHTHYAERPYGAFHRAFGLPDTVNAGGIAAAYSDGVLSVSLPKSEATKPRQIEVAVSGDVSSP